MADDLRAELAKRRKWFFETQLRRLNLDTFNGLVAETTDPDDRRLLDLVSEPAVAPPAPPGTASVVGEVYLDSGQPVWTADEAARRGPFAANYLGRRCGWLEYKEPHRLVEVLAGLAGEFENDRFSSVLEKSVIGSFPRRAATRNTEPHLTDGKGQAISRAMVAEAKPWLLPELYHPRHLDSSGPAQWLENLEQFVTDVESELRTSSGGTAGPAFDQDAPEAYGGWVRLAMAQELARETAAVQTRPRSTSDKVEVGFLAKEPNKDGVPAWKFDIRVAADGTPLGKATDYPSSHKVKYWSRVVSPALQEVYVNKPNSDMGLCLLVRMLYLFGTISPEVAAGDALRWRTRTAPGSEFDEFFTTRATDTFFADEQHASRLDAARTKLRILLETSAALPGTASVAFSPIVGEVLRQGIHHYKFWLDEPLRAKDNVHQQQVRTDLGYGGDSKGEMEYWSENHYIMFASSEYLAGQLWEFDEFLPGKEFLDGARTGVRSGLERRERGRARVLKWLNHRLMFGWTEFNSSGYYREHLWALLNLVDFAIDPEVREKATVVTDLLLFDVARFLHKGAMGAAGGRSQFKSKVGGWDNGLGDVVELLFGTRGMFGDGDAEIGSSMASSTYKVPDVLLEIGTHQPTTEFVDRSRVSITFDEAYRYGIWFSQESDAVDSRRQGYAPKLERHFPFLKAVNDQLTLTHTDYGANEDSTVFWWSTSAFVNKQMVRGALDCITKFGLEETGVFAELGGMVRTILPIVRGVTDTVAGVAIGGLLGGPVGAIAGGIVGFLTRDDVEEIVDDLSVLLEGSTRTRANIITYRNGDVMLSSIQNFRVGQLNYQSSVNQATLNNALSVFTTAGFAGIDISPLLSASAGALLGGLAGTLLGGPILGGVGVIAGAKIALDATEGAEGTNPIGDETDGPSWWTGYWALPMVVQHRGASIIAYDFHDVHGLLADNGSHVWFPENGFDSTEDVRCSSYDDGNFFLADVFDIGPKGFWTFGRVTHPVAGRPEAYIGVFSNRRPKALSTEEHADVYDGVLAKASVAVIADLAAKIEKTKDPEEKRELETQKANLERIWREPLPRDYFAGRDRYVDGKNVWIIHVGNKAEFVDYEQFKARVSSAKVTLDDAGDLECTYHMPTAGGGSQALSLEYGDGGVFGLDGGPLQTDLYPRFENDFLRGGRVEWGQRAYVIEYGGKLLLHDFHDFTRPVRAEEVTVSDEDRDTVRALVMFIRTGDEEMAEFTVGEATVTVGCVTVTEDQIVAVGPVDEGTQHDAEWVFFDGPAKLTPDLTLDLVHRAIGDGDDEAEWEVSFSVRALMADHRLVDCVLSFGAVRFDEDRRRVGPLPLTVVTDRWRPWEPVPDSRITGPAVLARRPTWHQSYYDYSDLLVVTPNGLLRHRRLRPCLDSAPEWSEIPMPPGLTPAASVRAVSSAPGQLVAVVLDAGALFFAELSADRRWSAWAREEPQVPLVSLHAAPSQLSQRGIELVATGADGHVHVNFDWQPFGTGFLAGIEVTGFTLRTDGDCVIAGDQLYVLATDGALWTAEVDRSPFFPAASDGVRVSPPEVALRSFTVVADSAPVRLLAVSSGGQVLDAIIHLGQTPQWAPLGSPADTPVPPAVRVAGTMTHAGRLDIFVTAGGVPYLRTWTESGWSEWAHAGGDVTGLRTADRTPLLVHRVNRQLELFVETTDGDLVRTWFS
jgi:hypothetical protein